MVLLIVAVCRAGDAGLNKEKVSKLKLLKVCHLGQKFTALDILERLEFKTFSCWPTMVAGNTFQCDMAPPV